MSNKVPCILKLFIFSCNITKLHAGASQLQFSTVWWPDVSYFRWSVPFLGDLFPARAVPGKVPYFTCGFLKNKVKQTLQLWFWQHTDDCSTPFDHSVGCNGRVALSVFSLVYSMDRRSISTLFMRPEKEISPSWNGLKNFFADSNIHCCWYGCNIVYCKDYHVIGTTIFYDVALF